MESCNRLVSFVYTSGLLTFLSFQGVPILENHPSREKCPLFRVGCVGVGEHVAIHKLFWVLFGGGERGRLYSQNPESTPCVDGYTSRFPLEA